MVKQRPRILLIDIETSPIIAHVWQMSLWNTNIRPEQIIKDTNILSFAAKWLDEDKIIYEDLSKKRDKSDDAPLLKSIWKLLDEADIVIVQNGVAFDIPTIKARMVAKNLPPMSGFKTVDTCKVARKHFNFSSNKLEFLARALNCKVQKHEHQKFPGLSLWLECIRGNRAAWKEMREYNIGDVLSLEEIYMKMRPWMPQHPNVGIYLHSDEPVCPKCGSKVESRGTRYTEYAHYRQYHCLNKECGCYPRGRAMLNTVKHRKNQLAN